MAHAYEIDIPVLGGEHDGDRRFFRLNPGMDVAGYPNLCPIRTVAVVASYVPFSGAEVNIYPVDALGEVLAPVELPGSYRGGLSHEYALQRAGFTVVLSLQDPQARIEAGARAYTQGQVSVKDGTDIHQARADREGISRQDAKRRNLADAYSAGHTPTIYGQVSE